MNTHIEQSVTSKLSNKKKPINKFAVNKTVTARLSLAVIFLSIGFMFLAIVIFMQWKDYANTSRLTLIKTSMTGDVEIDYYTDSEIEFYNATLRSTLFNHVDRCFSRIKKTIISDFQDCANLMSNDLQLNYINSHTTDEIGNVYSAWEVANDFINSTEEDVVADSYSWNFIKGVPSSTDNKTEIYTVIIYVKLNEEQEERVEVQFKFLTKLAHAKLDRELLKMNPIGLQIINQKILEKI